MLERLDIMKAKGCDAVEWDNADLPVHEVSPCMILSPPPLIVRPASAIHETVFGHELYGLLSSGPQHGTRSNRPALSRSAAGHDLTLTAHTKKTTTCFSRLKFAFTTAEMNLFRLHR